jgi:hypothetical protein
VAVALGLLERAFQVSKAPMVEIQYSQILLQLVAEVAADIQQIQP